MDQTQASVECGFCLRKDEALPQPKTLPCTHVHCLQCLSGFYEENHLIVCAASGCGEVFAGAPHTLPSHDMPGEDNKWCDICVRKKRSKEEAVSYCTYCCTKLCNSHVDSHDDTMDQHIKINMDEFRAQAKKDQTRNCTTHTNQPYSLACKLCLTLWCMKCLPDMDKCDNGTSHKLLSLDDCVAALLKEGISAEMLAKEDQYETLFKNASEMRAVYDNKTSQMVELIHQTRDAQINALKSKYKKLEVELREKRQKGRVNMAEFMEDIVLKKWTQIRNQRQLIETRVKHSHQADFVKGYRELKQQIQEFVVEQLPELKLPDQQELRLKGECREMELEVVCSDDLVVASEKGDTTPQHLPQSLTQLQSVQLPAIPFSVCHYNGSTYVGLDNKTVTKVDSNYKVYNSFISTSGWVDSISVYKDKIYTLSRGSPRKVGVYDMSGGRITSWNHSGGSLYRFAMVVVADQVVIPDKANNKITVYSLDGKILRHIPSPLPSIAEVRMCAVGEASVALSEYFTSRIYLVNITTGEVVWTCSDVYQPLGLVQYGDYILVNAVDNTTIYILDITTGNIISEMRDSYTAGNVCDLDVYGTTLVVPHWHSERLLLYQLNE